MRVKLLKHAVVGGSVEWAGTTHEVDDGVGRELVQMGLAEPTNAASVAVVQDIVLEPVALEVPAPVETKKKGAK